ncbi:MAG: IS4/IS5 family transposase, partial [Solobacterium sp.]|nr:IS4/IS5 family transposase [Solobacterium sp.]
MKFRVVRIRIDGNKEEYESVITNLDRDEFPKEEIKDLYMHRWNIMPNSSLCSKCRVLINAENNLNLLI